MGILYEIGQWRKARPIDRETTIRGPNRHQTIVWSLLDQPGEVFALSTTTTGRVSTNSAGSLLNWRTGFRRAGLITEPGWRLDIVDD